MLETARAATVVIEQKIYTSADIDVIPPRPISRQLPVAPPPGVRPHLIGRLELLIDRRGNVETVKLHTPQNGYHDGMIVSAAKDWHYPPR